MEFCDEARRTADSRRTSGMARLYRPFWTGPWESASAHDSASACFAVSATGFESPDPRWPTPTPNSNARIKKLRALARDVDLWAMDEVHFQQHGSRCRMWIPPEVKDPVLLHHPTRKSVKYFGAVRVRDGRFVFRREEGSFDAVTCHAFLRQLWNTTRRGQRRPVVIAANASYHHTPLHTPCPEAP